LKFNKYDAEENQPIEKSAEKGSKPKENNNLPLLCQELYYKYCMDFREDSFGVFYRSTVNMFLSVAAEKCLKDGKGRVDPREIVNRLYGLLVLHASRKGPAPFRAILSWCFGAISNMVKEEYRKLLKQAVLSRRIESSGCSPSPLDKLLQKEEKKKRLRLYYKIIELINSNNSIISERDRRVMELFYCESQSLRAISDIINIKIEHAAVILCRARKRIANHLKRANSL